MFRVGILGAGGMGNVHAAQYRKMSDVDLRFYEPLEDRKESFAKKHEADPVSNEDELIAWADVVDVCTPTDTHLDLGLKSVAAGKALFMEKPMARTLDECRTLMEAVAKAGVPMMPGQVVRFFPEYVRAKALVDSGNLGDIAAIRLRRGGGAPTGGAGNWFMDHVRSGGVFYDLAIHDFDWIRWVFGETKTVFARSIQAKNMKGPDYGLATMTLDSGAIAHVESTWMDPSGFRTTFEVCGSVGMIQHDSLNVATVRIHKTDGTTTDAPMAPTDDPYYLETRAFIEAVRSGTEPPVSGYDGFMACSLATAALESAQTGEPKTPARS